MSATLRKRCREPDSTDVRESNRVNGIGEETDLFSAFATAENEECASSEDYLIGVMRSLEEEVSATCSTLCAPISLDICSAGHEGQAVGIDLDLCYLLEASDDELGIPSSPVLDSKDEFCQAPKETFTAEGLSETYDLKWQGEKWGFVEEFKNQHFAFLEDAWDANHVKDYMNKDFICQDMLFEVDFSVAWTLETAGCM